MATCYTPTEMLAKLVGFPTVSDQSNLDLIAFVESYLSDHGVASTRVYDDTKQKAALFATVGPNVDGGVVLSAHTDVVPVEGQDWISDPFDLRAADGRLYGRGSADMKGFAAATLAHVPHFLAANLKVPIHIALSYDEEVGCFGAPPMIARMLADGPRPAVVFVGEPTNMQVVTGHKGIIVLKTKISGHAVHSSQLDRGVSAISVAAKLISWMDSRTAENLAQADPECPFNPPYTTLHCGTIKGGNAHNITAGHCEFITDIRLLPNESGAEWVQRYRKFINDSVLPGMKAISENCDIQVTEAANVPGLKPEANGAAELMARQLTGDNATNVVVYATEGGQFQEQDLSTVVCGPGSIDQAHQPNEFIEAAELAKCSAMLDQLCAKLS
ncbi:acetylornithine deacetylase [Roseibium algae]|uniref:acetylornithine deacetylase n=1 Tax=Roseibium algae TaxID=3123038 RepID=UPI0030ED03A8